MTVPEWREQVATYRRNAHTPLDSAVWAMRFASMLEAACVEIDKRDASLARLKALAEALFPNSKRRPDGGAS